jgi:hypothetical protein
VATVDHHGQRDHDPRNHHTVSIVQEGQLLNVCGIRAIFHVLVLGGRHRLKYKVHVQA